MKSSIFKYIFFICAILIIIGAIYFIYFRKEEKPEQQTNTINTEKQETSNELHLAISNFDTINPLLTNNKEVLNIDTIIFEPLIKIDENYKTSLCLAKECSKISPTTYLIKIDSNKKWSDNTSLTSKDVQFTIDRLKEGKSVYSYNVEKVSSVEIIDSETLKINLSQEVPFFEYNLTFPILPNNYYLGEDFNTSTKIPIGTGMYKISNIEASKITLVKNEKWWNIKAKNPKIDTIIIKLYKEVGEVYNSFKLGNVDMFTTSTTNIENYIGTIGYAKKEWQGRQFDYLAFNCQDTIFKDANVRKAIGMCIDRNNIVSSVYNNNAYVSEFPLDFGSYVYDGNHKSTSYQQEEAKKILINNGWTYTNNKWQKKIDKSYKKLDISITVQESNLQRVAVAENIKNQLEQLGIKVKVKKVNDSEYKTIIQNKAYQIILTGVYNSFSPSMETFLGANNLQNYENTEMLTLLKEVEEIKDDNILKEKYKRIVQIYDEELPFISLYRNKQTAVKGQNLAGELICNNYTSFYHIYNWIRM